MKKKLLAYITAAMCAVSAFSFAACGGNGGGSGGTGSGGTSGGNGGGSGGGNAQHVHSWSQDWERDGAHHWHNCTAEGCPVTDNSQKDGYAAHVFTNGVCVCGRLEPTAGLEYMLNSDGESYSVAGMGTATDTEIVIPAFHEGKPVTRIRNEAFEEETAIIKVVIPDGVTRIGDSAFYECKSLTSVTLPDGLTSIGDSAFA